MTRNISTAILFFCMNAFLHAQAGFALHEKPGKYVVGLSVTLQHDLARTFPGKTNAAGAKATGARPIQTLVWFPAKKATGARMTVAGYEELAATEMDLSKSTELHTVQTGGSVASSAHSQRLRAYRDAPPASGRFPVVIYAPGFSASPWENADACEYLASHGYIVLASPDMGATTRQMTGDLAGIDAQARDISFLIDYAQTLADANSSRIAVIGYSWGGISNLFAAARDERINALICWDGEMRYSPGLVAQAGYVHPERMKIPLLFLTQGEITLEEEAQWFTDRSKAAGSNPLNAWIHGDLVTVHMMGLVHFEFSSMAQRKESNWKGYTSNHKADYKREDGAVGYAWICRYTLKFLNAYLAGDESSLRFLKNSPRQNGVPEHSLYVTFRQKQP